MSSNDFFTQLKEFSDFRLLASDEIYRPVPADWFVAITDVEGSTEQVADGRYREINTVGAGAIALLQDLYQGEILPFIFGGDGATFLVAPSRVGEVKDALARYRRYCSTQYGVKLRAALISVQEILAAGQKLEAAKFSGAGGKCTAFIRGGGLAWADYSLKVSPRRYLVKEAVDAGNLPLANLSCRWEPLRSGRGEILTVLVQPRLFDSTGLFDGLLTEFQSILGSNLEQANPVKPETMRYGGLWASLRTEWKCEKNKLSSAFRKRLFEILLCQWSFRLGWPVPFDAKRYLAQIPSHSDFRKYDDMLRLVLDCSKEQSAKIEETLRRSFERGDIFFGLTRSSHALMTCLVQSIGDGGHIHLIDGGEGGYTLAAQKLSQQRRGDKPAVSA